MSKEINVRIITPLCVVLEVQAMMVSIPGESGEFGVLPGHEQLIASLSRGVVKIYKDTLSTWNIAYFIHDGIAEVTGSNVEIITEFATDVSKLSEEEISFKILSKE